VKDYRAGTGAISCLGAELSQGRFISLHCGAGKSSPADQAGVRAGDIIEYIDGKPTRDISL